MKCTCGQDKDICVDCMKDYIEKLENRLFALGEMEYAPCFVCGYNGEGYFQPEKHPCAERHHKLFKA
jgi:hypothetical protein